MTLQSSWDLVLRLYKSDSEKENDKALYKMLR